jgi:hypothetical protein
MVLPPSGTARGEFEAGLAAAERQFLKKGLTVISPAITGRVAALNDTDKTDTRRGAELSDAERALILAKSSNADAVLQIGTFRWSSDREDPLASRYFVAQGDAFKETTKEAWANTSPSLTHRCWAPVLHFTGRLIDVESGEVLASFNTRGPAIRNIESTFEVSDRILDRRESVSEFDVGSGVETIDRLFSMLADVIAGSRPDNPNASARASK